jgi:hypothetical protein
MNRERESIQAVESMTKSLTTYASQTALIRLVEKLEKDEVPRYPLTGLLGDPP